MPDNVPGVDPQGLCQDPKAYFFSVIQRAPGQPAQDWVQVLTDSGFPPGYPPYQVPASNGRFGLTQQTGADGVRGRLFLPTQQVDSLGYYSHPIDILADGSTPGSLVWAWRDELGGPPYVAWIKEPGQTGTWTPADGGSSGGGTTPPATDPALEQRIAALEAGAVMRGSNISLQSQANGKYLRVEQGTGVVDASAETPYEWEKFKVDTI